MKKLLVVAMEEGIVEGSEPVSDEELFATSQGLDETEALVEDGNDQMDEALVSIDRIEELAAIVERKPAGEEVTSTEVAIVEASLENIYDSLGVKRPRGLGLEEGAGGVGAFVSRVKEQVIRLFYAIVDVFKRAYAWLRDLFDKLTDAAGRYGKRADALKQQLAKAGDELTAETYQNTNIYQRLNTYHFSLGEAYENLVELVKDSVKVANGKQVEVLNKLIDDYASSNMTDHAAQVKLIEGFPKVLETAYNGVFTETFEGAEVHNPIKGVTVHSTDLLPANYVGALWLPDAVDTLEHFDFKLVQIKLDEQGATIATDPKGGMKVADKKEVAGLLENTKKICDAIKAFRSEERKLASIPERLTKSIDKLKKSNDLTISDEQKVFLRTLVKMAPALVRGIHQRTFPFALRAADAVMDHCEASMKNYKVD